MHACTRAASGAGRAVIRPGSATSPICPVLRAVYVMTPPGFDKVYSVAVPSPLFGAKATKMARSRTLSLVNLAAAVPLFVALFWLRAYFCANAQQDMEFSVWIACLPSTWAGWAALARAARRLLRAGSADEHHMAMQVFESMARSGGVPAPVLKAAPKRSHAAVNRRSAGLNSLRKDLFKDFGRLRARKPLAGAQARGGAEQQPAAPSLSKPPSPQYWRGGRRG